MPSAHELERGSGASRCLPRQSGDPQPGQPAVTAPGVSTSPLRRVDSSTAGATTPSAAELIPRPLYRLDTAQSFHGSTRWLASGCPAPSGPCSPAGRAAAPPGRRSARRSSRGGSPRHGPPVAPPPPRRPSPPAGLPDWHGGRAPRLPGAGARPGPARGSRGEVGAGRRRSAHAALLVTS
jgi:hypothetical protein